MISSRAFNGVFSCTLVWAVFLLPAVVFSATVTPAAKETGSAVTAFVDVNVIPMDRPGVLLHYTVMVRDGRIAEMGPTDRIAVPPGARVIAGDGRAWLTPGLTDAHVHLDGMVGARPDFGDAPLFLAYGVTTVFNLRGEPVHLEWKRRIQDGQLLAPNLYNAGEFVNEPRVRTPDEAEREVREQRQAGYDILKFREVIDFKAHRIATTEGLALPAYLSLNDTARSLGMPLLGHAPFRVGLDGLLQGRQSLAHTNELANLHFLPPLGLRGKVTLDLGRWSLLALCGLALGGVIYAGARRLWRRRTGTTPLRATGTGTLPGLLAIAGLACAVLWLLVVPPGRLYGNEATLLTLSGLAVAFTLGVLMLLWRIAGAWRRRSGSILNRCWLIVSLLAAVGFTIALAQWVPFAWRGSPAHVQEVAHRCGEAKIWVQSTLVLYEIGMGVRDGYRYDQMVAQPAFRFLPPELQAEWRGVREFFPSWLKWLWGHHPAFTRSLVAALHHERVPLMAGTDALGVPFVIPGESLHRELMLLAECGLTPWEVLQTATANPARFLGREQEFGRISVGARADLLLVDGDPLADLGRLRQPSGVMVRGVWLTRSDLDARLSALAAGGEEGSR